MVKKEFKLRDFILRGEAIKLYRQYLRLVNAAPPHARGNLMMQLSLILEAIRLQTEKTTFFDCLLPGDLKKEIRREFECHKETDDVNTKKHILSDGRTRLKQLRDTLGMQS